MYALNFANLASKNLPVRHWNRFENGPADLFAVVCIAVSSVAAGIWVEVLLLLQCSVLS